MIFHKVWTLFLKLKPVYLVSNKLFYHPDSEVIIMWRVNGGSKVSINDLPCPAIGHCIWPEKNTQHFHLKAIRNGEQIDRYLTIRYSKYHSLILQVLNLVWPKNSKVIIPSKIKDQPLSQIQLGHTGNTIITYENALRMQHSTINTPNSPLKFSPVILSVSHNIETKPINLTLKDHSII